MSVKRCASLHHGEIGWIRGDVGQWRQNAAEVPAAEGKKSKRYG
jgi:hypothetical protein